MFKNIFKRKLGSTTFSKLLRAGINPIQGIKMSNPLYLFNKLHQAHKTHQSPKSLLRELLPF